MTFHPSMGRTPGATMAPRRSPAPRWQFPVEAPRGRSRALPWRHLGRSAASCSASSSSAPEMAGDTASPVPASPWRIGCGLCARPCAIGRHLSANSAPCSTASRCCLAPASRLCRRHAGRAGEAPASFHAHAGRLRVRRAQLSLSVTTHLGWPENPSFDRLAIFAAPQISIVMAEVEAPAYRPPRVWRLASISASLLRQSPHDLRRMMAVNSAWPSRACG